MPYAAYQFTNNEKIPAVVSLGKKQTPVWIQQRWEEGEFAKYIRGNGCGHCCTAMAAQLHGVSIDPSQEYMLCRSLWGAPDEVNLFNWLSVAGITKILTHLHIPALCRDTLSQGVQNAAKDIVSALKDGKQVIFVSTPDHFPDNPFSSGDHYVLAVGLTEDGSILIANSSLRGSQTGIQHTDLATIEKALPPAGTAAPDKTWGEPAYQQACYGYVIVG